MPSERALLIKQRQQESLQRQKDEIAQRDAIRKQKELGIVTAPTQNPSQHPSSQTLHDLFNSRFTPQRNISIGSNYNNNESAADARIKTYEQKRAKFLAKQRRKQQLQQPPQSQHQQQLFQAPINIQPSTNMPSPTKMSVSSNIPLSSNATTNPMTNPMRNPIEAGTFSNNHLQLKDMEKERIGHIDNNEYERKQTEDIDFREEQKQRNYAMELEQQMELKRLSKIAERERQLLEEKKMLLMEGGFLDKFGNNQTSQRLISSSYSPQLLLVIN